MPKSFLKSSIQELEEKDATIFHKARIAGSALHKHKRTMIRNSPSDDNKKQICILENKLNTLIRNSKWSKVGRKDIITNLSGFKLSDTQLEAISFGPKFATGLPKNDITEIGRAHV